jgi:holliday junction DNA helicase RuvA
MGEEGRGDEGFGGQAASVQYNPRVIGYLHGQLLKATPERLLLDVQGVGYEVHVPLSTWYEIEKRRDEPIRLFIHTHMREDGIALFGFWTEREKLLFERLIAVSGIGPRLARVILSGMAPDDLLGAIAGGDVGRLSTIPGVGKKTAERMVLELKDKMRELAAELPETTVAPAADQDVVSALVNLGYKSSLAERAVADVRRERPDAAFHELLRSSLNRLSRA